MFRYLNIPYFVTEPNNKIEFIKIDNSNSGYMLRDINLSEYNNFNNWFQYNYDDKINLGHVTQMYTLANSIMTIHSDLENENSFAKLNFNFADKRSRLQFFKVKDRSKIEYKEYKQDNDLKFEEKVPTIKEEDAEFICEATQDTTYPTLVNGGEFHRAYNKETNVPRCVISFSLLNKDNSYLTFDDACDTLSKCIIDI